MSRINIEEVWWSDPRRERLGSLVGGMYMADAVIIRAWRVAQEFWKRGQLVPENVFNTIEHAPSIIQAQLGEVQANGVYVRGSSQYFDWAREAKSNAAKNGQKGGKKSAKRPLNAKGHLLPNEANVQAPSKQDPSETKPDPSESKLSGSGSNSNSNSGVVCMQIPTTPPVGANSAQSFQNRFSVAQSDIDLVRDILGQVWVDGLPPDLRRDAWRIVDQFGSVAAFASWFQDKLNNPKALPSNPESRNFLSGCIYHQLDARGLA